MNYRFIFIPLFVAGLTACGDEKVRSRPDYVLSEAQFVEVLVDFALAESAASINIKNVRSDMIDSVYAFDPLAQHGVSKVDYDSTIAWYARDPALYKEVYQKVLARLSEMESRRKTTTADSASISQTAPARP